MVGGYGKEGGLGAVVEEVLGCREDGGPVEHMRRGKAALEGRFGGGFQGGELEGFVLLVFDGVYYYELVVGGYLFGQRQVGFVEDEEVGLFCEVLLKAFGEVDAYCVVRTDGVADADDEGGYDRSPYL